MSSIAAQAPSIAAVHPRRPPSRAVAYVRARADTPRVLLAALFAIWGLAFALLLLTNWSNASARQAVVTIGKDTAPAIISAQSMKASMIRMDASTANDLLYGRDGSKDAEATYEQYRQVVGRGIVAASRNVTVAGEQSLVESLQNNMGLYQQYAAQVRVHSQNGDTAAAVASMRAATSLMQEKIVPASNELDAVNLRALEDAYAARQRTAIVVQGLLAVVGILFVILLGAVQFFLMRRTTRILSPFLIAATLVVIALVLRTGLTAADASRDLRIARDDAFLSTHALLQAKADAYDANADQSLYLVPGFDKDAYDQSFRQKAALLVDRPLEDQLTSAVPSSNLQFKGLLGDAWRDVTFPGEREALQEALRAWAWFVVSDLHIRAAERTGRHDAAIEWATGTKPGDTVWAFTQFEQAMDKVIAVNQQEFDTAINRALGRLAYGELIDIVAALVIAGLAWLALWPRVGEYGG
jgi:hypothetical protein